MKNEFVSYEHAFALKELGFDEDCFGYYNDQKFQLNCGVLLNELDLNADNINAPLYQQAFSFLREKYKLYHHIYQDLGWNISGGIWDIAEHKGIRYDWDSENKFSSYRESENDCLTKLIEIVNEHKNKKIPMPKM